MVIDAEELRQHLNMTSDEAAMSGAPLNRFLGAAIAHTEAQLGFLLADDMPADLRLAVLMLAATWFESRESVLIGVSAQIVPHGYDAIIANYRSYTLG